MLVLSSYSFLGFNLRTAEAQSSEGGEQLGSNVAAVTLPAYQGDALQGMPAPALLLLHAVGFRRAFTPQEWCRSKAAGSHSQEAHVVPQPPKQGYRLRFSPKYPRFWLTG